MKWASTVLFSGRALRIVVWFLVTLFCNLPASADTSANMTACTMPKVLCDFLSPGVHTEPLYAEYVNEGQQLRIKWAHARDFCVYLTSTSSLDRQRLPYQKIYFGNAFQTRTTAKFVDVPTDRVRPCQSYTVWLEPLGSNCIDRNIITVGPHATFQGVSAEPDGKNWTVKWNLHGEKLNSSRVKMSFRFREWEFASLRQTNASEIVADVLHPLPCRSYEAELTCEYEEFANRVTFDIPSWKKGDSKPAILSGFRAEVDPMTARLSLVWEDVSKISSRGTFTFVIDIRDLLDILKPVHERYVVSWKKAEDKWESSNMMWPQEANVTLDISQFESCRRYDFRVKPADVEREFSVCWSEINVVYVQDLNLTAGVQDGFLTFKPTKTAPCLDAYTVSVPPQQKIPAPVKQTSVASGPVVFRELDFCSLPDTLQVRVEPHTTGGESHVPIEFTTTVTKADLIKVVSCKAELIPDTFDVLLTWTTTAGGLKCLDSKFSVGIPSESLTVIAAGVFDGSLFSERIRGLSAGVQHALEVRSSHSAHGCTATVTLRGAAATSELKQQAGAGEEREKQAGGEPLVVTVVLLAIATAGCLCVVGYSVYRQRRASEDTSTNSALPFSRMQSSGIEPAGEVNNVNLSGL